MQFPVYIPVPFTSLNIYPHPFFEGLAYIIGLSTMFLARYRRRELGSPSQLDGHLWLSVAALFGAIAGAKLLAFAESPSQYWQHRDQWTSWIEGKTIVGGLVGGWIAVEIVKKAKNITRSTGDAWVLPLCIAISIGRLGCFFTGLADQTHGLHSSLPWAVNFGDGPRHPAQLYESLFTLLLGAALLALPRLPPGKLFRIFLLAYLVFRFAVEFIKPSSKPFAGLSAIQLVALATSLYLVLFEIPSRRTARQLEQSTS